RVSTARFGASRFADEGQPAGCDRTCPCGATGARFRTGERGRRQGIAADLANARVVPCTSPPCVHRRAPLPGPDRATYGDCSDCLAEPFISSAPCRTWCERAIRSPTPLARQKNGLQK